ncbi:MAG: thermonuclease family protein [Hyphomicrobiaceae bacterium]|nr:thermonuclease family protein [Hyphomicrobiaceae bacterium]
MMFGWRKRSEGFEWREYVRTTILVRRADRQKRMDDARMAALAKVRDARDRGVNAGLEQVEAVKNGAAVAANKAGNAIAGAAVGGARRAAGGARGAAALLGRAASAMPRPSMPKGLKALAADFAMYGADVPRRWRLIKPYLLPMAGAAAAIFVFGAAFSPERSGLQRANAGASGSARAMKVSAQSSTANADPAVVSGRARVVSGDRLRVGGKLLHLAGIDAPHPAQPCYRSNGRRWGCAASAVSTLRRLVRGRKVACELNKQGSGEGPIEAHCRAGDLDIAAAMVRTGYAFASADLGTPYASEEETARGNKAGIWQGETDRPEIWRAKVWDEAKKTAPDGCPIRGVVSSRGAVYAMPWAEGYDRRKIRKIKDERWFCSEEEAQAAGFKLTTKL